MISEVSFLLAGQVLEEGDLIDVGLSESEVLLNYLLHSLLEDLVGDAQELTVLLRFD